MDTQSFQESMEYDLYSGTITPPFPKQFTLLHAMHEGAFSQLFLLVDYDVPAFYTLKVIKRNNGFDLDPNALKQLNHKRLPKIHYIGVSKHYHYVIKSYIPGESLSHHIKLNGPFSPLAAKDLLIQLLTILKALHTQNNPVIFRDIKPDNMIMDPEGRLFLIDLETSRIQKEDRASDTIKVVTHGYTAPEQYGYNQTDARSDIYAVGKTFQYMLTGTNTDQPVESYHSSLIKKATRLNPKKRYQTAESMLQAIKRYPLPYKLYPMILALFGISLFLIIRLAFISPTASEAVSPANSPDIQADVMTDIPSDDVTQYQSNPNSDIDTAIGSNIDSSTNSEPEPASEADLDTDLHTDTGIDPDLDLDLDTGIDPDLDLDLDLDVPMEAPVDLVNESFAQYDLPGVLSTESIDDELLASGTKIPMGTIYQPVGYFKTDLYFNQDLKKVMDFTPGANLSALNHPENDFDSKFLYTLKNKDTQEIMHVLQYATGDYYNRDEPHNFIYLESQYPLASGNYSFSFHNYPTEYGYLNGIYTWDLVVK